MSINPLSNPEDCDVIEIGSGLESPGVCFLSGFKRVHEFDKKKGKGTQGATLTFSQKPPVEGTVKFIFWEEQHFDAWDAFAAHLKYDPSRKTVKAVDIFHPFLAQINATSFVCEDLGAYELEGQPGGGMYSVTIKLVEYFPPPPKPFKAPTPASSDAFVGPLQPAPDPFAAKQAQIAALLAKATKP